MPLKINFSYNWNNKLNCDAFTTLRLRDDSKYFAGAQGEAYLKNELVSAVMIVAIKHFTIDKINEHIARVDTGYPREKAIAIIKTMYKNRNLNWETQRLSFIMLIKIKQ
jgi:hypothetical protein